jgi:hypothetical protein
MQFAHCALRSMATPAHPTRRYSGVSRVIPYAGLPAASPSIGHEFMSSHAGVRPQRDPRHLPTWSAALDTQVNDVASWDARTLK